LSYLVEWWRTLLMVCTTYGELFNTCAKYCIVLMWSSLPLHWYIRDVPFPSVSHVQIMGMPLSGKLGVAPRGTGVVLSYYPTRRKNRTSQWVVRGWLSQQLHSFALRV
jgi:hypothetical protein